MGKRLSRSRTFAVILTQGEQLNVKFLWAITDIDSGASELVEKNILTPWASRDRDALIKLLVEGGHSVRFYDPEEKLWLEHSLFSGYNAVSGSRDGQYSTPDLDEFKEEYLQTT